MKIFAYGTILNKITQLKLFRYKLDYYPAMVKGYKVEFSLSPDGNIFPNLIPDPTGIVYGKVFDVSNNEFKLINEHETKIYNLVKIKTENNEEINTFIK